MEVYTPERKAEFLLSDAVNAADYRAALTDVKALGLDPAKIIANIVKKRNRW